MMSDETMKACIKQTVPEAIARQLEPYIEALANTYEEWRQINRECAYHHSRYALARLAKLRQDFEQAETTRATLEDIDRRWREFVLERWLEAEQFVRLDGAWRDPPLF